MSMTYLDVHLCGISYHDKTLFIFFHFCSLLINSSKFLQIKDAIDSLKKVYMDILFKSEIIFIWNKKCSFNKTDFSHAWYWTQITCQKLIKLSNHSFTTNIIVCMCIEHINYIVTKSYWFYFFKINIIWWHLLDTLKCDTLKIVINSLFSWELESGETCHK